MTSPLTRLASRIVVVCAVVGCGSAESSDRSEIDRAVRIAPSAVDVVIDSTGITWIAEVDDGMVELTAVAPDGHPSELGLGGGREEVIGHPRLVSVGRSAVAVWLRCADSRCEEADVRVQGLAAGPDGPILDGEGRAAPERTTDLTRPQLVGRQANEALVLAGGVLIRVAPGVEPEPIGRLAEGLGDACLVDGMVVAARSRGGQGESSTPEATAPTPGGVVEGSLVRFDEGGEWVDLPASEWSIPAEGGAELRCGEGRLEVAVPGQVATDIWIGDGSWTRTDAAPVAWRLEPSAGAVDGLVGVVGREIVRVDSATGEVLASLDLTDDLDAIIPEPPGPDAGDLPSAALIDWSPEDPMAVVCISQEGCHAVP